IITLTVPSGTLTNTGTMTLSDSGGNCSCGVRNVTAELDNQGTLTVDNSVNNTWSVNRSGANHTNSGTISLSGGHLAIAGAGSFTNTGARAVSGGTLTISA